MLKRSNGKLQAWLIVYSEQRIEGLKQHFDQLGITVNDKWLDVEVKLKKEKD